MDTVKKQQFEKKGIKKNENLRFLGTNKSINERLCNRPAGSSSEKGWSPMFQFNVTAK